MVQNHKSLIAATAGGAAVLLTAFVLSRGDSNDVDGPAPSKMVEDQTELAHSLETGSLTPKRNQVSDVKEVEIEGIEPEVPDISASEVIRSFKPAFESLFFENYPSLNSMATKMLVLFRHHKDDFVALAEELRAKESNYIVAEDRFGLRVFGNGYNLAVQFPYHCEELEGDYEIELAFNGNAFEHAFLHEARFKLELSQKDEELSRVELESEFKVPQSAKSYRGEYSMQQSNRSSIGRVYDQSYKILPDGNVLFTDNVGKDFGLNNSGATVIYFTQTEFEAQTLSPDSILSSKLLYQEIEDIFKDFTTSNN